MTLEIHDWKQEGALAATVRESLTRLPQELIYGITKNATELADTDAWAEEYGIPLNETANVVIVEWRKSKSAVREFAAVLVLADSKADLNNSVKKALHAYKVSFAPSENATVATSMEPGGMSPIGLPPGWPLIIDERVLAVQKLYIGSGIRTTKLVVDGNILQHIEHARVEKNMTKVVQ